MEDYLTPDITAARDAASAQSTRAGEFASASASVGDVLKEKALKAYQDNQDIIKPLDTATAGYLSAPATARAKYENIFNPFQREALVSQYTSNEAIPMLSYSGMYGNRMGRVSDIIGTGTNAFNAQSALETSRATTAQKQYENLLDEYKVAQEQKNWEAEYNLKAGEKKESDYLAALKADVTSGMGLDAVMKTYSDKISSDEILRQFNINSPTGPAEMDYRELEKRYGIKPSTTQIEDADVRNIADSVSGLKTEVQNLDLSKPKDLFTYNKKRTLVSRYLAKLVEKNRISDQDAEVYLSMFPSIGVATLSRVTGIDFAGAQLNELVKSLYMKLGIKPPLENF